MQAKHYALTALVSAVVAMSAQAQTSYPGSSTPSQVNTPAPTETQSGQVPDTQPSTPIIVEKRAPGVTTAATREDVRAETLSEMKAGNIPRGEQSTPTHGTKPDSLGSEMLWKQ